MGSACRVLRKSTMTHGIQILYILFFVSNQEMFAIKSCAQQSGAFNLLVKLTTSNGN